MSSKIQSGSNTAGLANVDATYNLNVNTPLVEAEAGFVALLAENDAGTVTGTRATRALEVSPDFRLRVGVDTMAFNENFPGAALNSGIWTAVTNTMTSTVSGGFLNLNAAASLSPTASSRVQTYRSFPCYKSYNTYFEIELAFTSTPVINNTCEWGAFYSTNNTAPTDGAFFRLNAAGEFRAVINNNGTETQSGTLDFNALVGVNTSKAFLINLGSNNAYFWIDNILVATVSAPAGQGTITASQALPLAFRNVNSASAPSTAQIMKVAMVNVTLADQNASKNWSDVIAGGGGHASQGQTGGIIGSTSLYTNNLVAGAGVAPTNTTAALGSGLGGQFSVQPTLAQGTDGIISSYQVPVGSAALPGKSLYITRINIHGMVTTALTGGFVGYAWSLAYGHTAVSLTTTETTTTKAPRRLPIGMQSYPATAAAGTLGQSIDIDLIVPIVVQPGEFVQAVAKNLGVVTSAGVITCLVSFGGYWE